MLSTASSARKAILQLQESYLATLSNLAPLITKFSATTANRLLSLFAVYSSPKYLFATERSHVRLFYFLYMIDSIIQYQYAGNAQIIYTFTRNRDKIAALRDMTFESALEFLGKAKDGDQSPKSAGSQAPPSEKTQGKKPIPTAQSSSGFIATAAWFKEWKQRLPIQVLSIMTDYLAPQITSYCIDNELSDETRVLEYLASKTMVGVLPQPHPIILHNFMYTKEMHYWVTAYYWVL